MSLKSSEQDQNTARNFTRGGQITFHNWRMFIQINKVVGQFFFWVTLFLSSLGVYFATPKDTLQGTYYYYYAWLMHFLHQDSHTFTINYHGQAILENATTVLGQSFFKEAQHAFWLYVIWSVIISGIVAILLSIIFVKWLTNKGKIQNSDRFLRGSKKADVETVSKLIRTNKSASDIVIDQLPLIKNSETQHILVNGTTGSGKGQLIMKILDCLRARGDRVIIYDKGCSFTQYFFREGKDSILNAFDERCENWDLWSEALDEPDFENMAESLIPMHGETDPFWVNAARTIFAAVAFKMRKDRDRSLDKLLKVILTSELQQLEKYLSGTEAATLASDKIEKTAISIRSIITTYLKSLKYLQGLHETGKPKFSIREWILDESKDNWLFINSNARQHAALRPLISTWFSMASIALLSLPENLNRRIWFIVDELPSLHKLPQLPETTAEARKFGGCFLFGMQSFAQMDKTYGSKAAKEVSDLLNTRFYFLNPSAEMAKHTAIDLGEEEYEDSKESYSYGANAIRDGISTARQRVVRPIVTHSEIMNMKNLEFYARLPGNYPIVHGNLALTTRPVIASGFIARKLPDNLDTQDTEESDNPNDSAHLHSERFELKKSESGKLKMGRTGRYFISDHSV